MTYIFGFFKIIRGTELFNVIKFYHLSQGKIVAVLHHENRERDRNHKIVHDVVNQAAMTLLEF